MADIAIFRINYKSDFILTLQSDAGWLTPFCIKFWTGAPSKAYYAYYDGMSYTHCTPVEGDPTKLLVQFDDHHLPIGDLKFQIGYHFTVADFPTSIEDEVINQASVIIEVDDAPAQVMLDFNGETAPEIEFSLPAYANEAQRIANEQARIAAEEQRISNEEARIAAEQERQQNEQQRISREQQRIEQEQQRVNAEAERVTDFNTQMQQQQTAYADAEAARDTAFDEAETERDAKVDAKVADITNLQAQIGYFVCDTGASVAAKTIAAAGYVLTTGGNIRIKMTNANTADSATLNINSTGAKALFYNGTQASSTNSWEAGEVIEVYYDGTRYQASNAQGGGNLSIIHEIDTTTGYTDKDVAGADAVQDILKMLGTVYYVVTT